MDHWRNQRENQNISKDKWKHDDPKPMGCSKSSSKRKVYINTILPQEKRKISNKKPILTPKAIKKKNKQNPKLVEGEKS